MSFHLNFWQIVKGFCEILSHEEKKEEEEACTIRNKLMNSINYKWLKWIESDQGKSLLKLRQ